MSDPLSEAAEDLRRYGLRLPESHEAHPWGHIALKVRGKAFAFLSSYDDNFSISVKLPLSHLEALELPYAEPTGYGLGKSGWVTGRFGPGDDVPLETIHAWLVESYRAVAPRKLARELPADFG